MPSGQVHLHMHRWDQAGAQAGQHRRQSQCSVQAHLRKVSQTLSGCQNWKFIGKATILCPPSLHTVYRFSPQIPLLDSVNSRMRQKLDYLSGCFSSLRLPDCIPKFGTKIMYSFGSHVHVFMQHSPHSLTPSSQPSLRTMTKFSLNKSTLSIYNLDPHLGLDALMQLTFCALFKSF